MYRRFQEKIVTKAPEYGLKGEFGVAVLGVVVVFWP